MKSLSNRLEETSKNTLGSLMPMLIAIIELVGLFETIITPQMLHSLFNRSVK